MQALRCKSLKVLRGAWDGGAFLAALIVLLKPSIVTILSDTSVSGPSVSQLPALFVIEPSRNIDFFSLLQKKIKKICSPGEIGRAHV